MILVRLSMLLLTSLDQAPLTTTCPAEPWDMILSVWFTLDIMLRDRN